MTMTAFITIGSYLLVAVDLRIFVVDPRLLYSVRLMI